MSRDSRCLNSLIAQLREPLLAPNNQKRLVSEQFLTSLCLVSSRKATMFVDIRLEQRVKSVLGRTRTIVMRFP